MKKKQHKKKKRKSNRCSQSFHVFNIKSQHSNSKSHIHLQQPPHFTSTRGRQHRPSIHSNTRKEGRKMKKTTTTATIATTNDKKKKKKRKEGKSLQLDPLFPNGTKQNSSTGCGLGYKNNQRERKFTTLVCPHLIHVYKKSCIIK